MPLRFSKSIRCGIRNCRSGVTLVEVLVVIAMVAMLIGILIPSLGAAREAARVLECTNHLKQLGLAVSTYESKMGHLPPGTLGVAEAYKPHELFLDDSHPYYWNGYGSSHAVIGFVFGDGHVEFLARDIDPVAFYRMCGRSDQGMAFQLEGDDSAARLVR